MENLLKRIEKSGANNHLLDAALAEIERLNKKLEEIKGIIESQEIKSRVGDEPFVILEGYELMQAKINFIEGIISPNY